MTALSCFGGNEKLQNISRLNIYLIHNIHCNESNRKCKKTQIIEILQVNASITQNIFKSLFLVPYFIILSDLFHNSSQTFLKHHKYQYLNMFQTRYLIWCSFALIKVLFHITYNASKVGHVLCKTVHNK